MGGTPDHPNRQPSAGYSFYKLKLTKSRPRFFISNTPTPQKIFAYPPISSPHDAKCTNQVDLIQLFGQLPCVAIIIAIQVKIGLVAAKLCIIGDMPDRVDKIGAVARLCIYRLGRRTVPLTSCIHHLVGNPKKMAYITRILYPDIGTTLIGPAVPVTRWEIERINLGRDCVCAYTAHTYPW
jgi:hypothetical protein